MKGKVGMEVRLGWREGCDEGKVGGIKGRFKSWEGWDEGKVLF